MSESAMLWGQVSAIVKIIFHPNRTKTKNDSKQEYSPHISRRRHLPANCIVFLNSSRKMLRTWRTPASPYNMAKTQQWSPQNCAYQVFADKRQHSQQQWIWQQVRRSCC